MCPKCAVSTRFGALSCCAPSASWYKNCGRTGDSNFDHTWTEGFKACKSAAKLSLLTTAVTHQEITAVEPQAKQVPDTVGRGFLVAAISPVCPRCAMIKRSGKLSCCARSASWHKNCGGTGDSNFGHTWAEGLEACKNAERLSLVVTELNHTLFNQTSAPETIDTAQNRSVYSGGGGGMHDASSANCKVHDQILHVVIFTTGSLLNMVLQVYASSQF